MFRLISCFALMLIFTFYHVVRKSTFTEEVLEDKEGIKANSEGIFIEPSEIEKIAAGTWNEIETTSENSYDGGLAIGGCCNGLYSGFFTRKSKSLSQPTSSPPLYLPPPPPLAPPYQLEGPVTPPWRTQSYKEQLKDASKGVKKIEPRPGRLGDSEKAMLAFCCCCCLAKWCD